MRSSYRTVQAWPTYLKPDALVNSLRDVMSTQDLSSSLSRMQYHVTHANKLDRSQLIGFPV